MSGYVADDISALLSMPIEQLINTNVVILESDKFTDEALNLMKEKHARSVRRGRRHREQD